MSTSFQSVIRRTLPLSESYHAPSFIKSRTRAAIEPFGFKHVNTYYHTSGGRAHGATHTFEHPDGRKVFAEMGKAWSDQGRTVAGSRWTVQSPGKKDVTFYHKDDLVDHLTPKGLEQGGSGTSVLPAGFTPKLSNHAILTARGFVKSEQPGVMGYSSYTHPDKPGVEVHVPQHPFGDPSVSYPAKRPFWPGHRLNRYTKNTKLDATLDNIGK